MADKKLTELEELTDVAGDDWLYVVDVSDTTHGGNGTSKKLRASKVYRGYANVLEYGADPTGDSDSATAFQNAVDSDYPVYAPPGKYRLDSAVVVDKPKIIDFGGASTRTITPESDTEQVRIIKTNNTGFFEIRSGQVHGYGGCFDSSGATGWNKDVFRYPFVANGSLAGGEGDRDGWAGGWRDFTYIGLQSDLSDTSRGGNVIHLDTSSEVNWAYWYFHKWTGVVWYAGRAFYAPAINPTYNQTANNCHIDIEVQHSRQAVHNESVNRLTARVSHQSRNIFASEAQSQDYPSVYSTTKQNVWNCVFFDFRKPASGGLYHNYYSYDITSPDGTDVLYGDSGLQWADTVSGCIPTGGKWASGVRRDSSNNLSDQTAPVNALGFKREGYMVFNADTNEPVWASGSAATDVWVDATGSTARTPS